MPVSYTHLRIADDGRRQRPGRRHLVGAFAKRALRSGVGRGGPLDHAVDVCGVDNAAHRLHAHRRLASRFHLPLLTYLLQKLLWIGRRKILGDFMVPNLYPKNRGKKVERHVQAQQIQRLLRELLFVRCV